MRTHLWIYLCVLGLVFGKASQAQPYGLTQRVANTTLQMPQNPQTFGYTMSNAFGSMSITNPTTIVVPPGETNRLFVLEQDGRIIAITNLSNPNRTMFMDFANRVSGGGENGLLGMAFHPGYLTNRYFYIFYTQTTRTTNYPSGTNWLSGRHQRISRFQISAGNTNQSLASTEVPILTLYDEAANHNGGDLHFGPDGYLYISLGDEGGQNDFWNNSQRIDKDMWSGILRIDVDKRAGNLTPTQHPSHHPTNNPTGTVNYLIPADNPFVGATTFNGSAININALRAEFWAVGMRNPWRFSFDVDGTLYCGDVGGDLREEVNVVTRGGNYGWAYREGTFNGPKAAQTPTNFTSINPLLSYAHGSGTNQGFAITGGVVYRGSRLAQLFGAYVFADYYSSVWALRHSGTNVTSWQYLMTDTGIAGFGVDPRNGDILVADQELDTIRRLIYNSSPSGSPLPATLANTGVFSDLQTLTPHAGIVPYDINVPFWSDNAKKTRWFSIPNTNLTMTFSRDGNWSFPTGTVWIKHFDLELTNGVPSSAKRLETRLLVKNTNGVYGAVYRWGSSTTNATLVGEDGLDESFVINDGGILRTQVWHYPSRAECLSCHTAVAGHALGFNTAQMNRDFDYGGTIDNQIRSLSHAGYFSAPVTNQNTLRQMAHATNDAWSVEWRVRSYLAANCVQCHQPGGAALGSWDARITNPLSLSGLINGSLNNNLGDGNNRVIVPNDAAHSVLLTRISTNGALRMPPLASNLTDTNSINLVTTWISSLAGYQTFAEWQLASFGSTNAPLTGASEDFDADGSVNFSEYLLGTIPTDAVSNWRIALQAPGGQAQVQFQQIANRGFEVQVTTNLQTPVLWRSLDVSGNRPFISSTNFSATVSDVITNTPKFYRVRVFEP